MAKNLEIINWSSEDKRKIDKGRYCNVDIGNKSAVEIHGGEGSYRNLWTSTGILSDEEIEWERADSNFTEGREATITVNNNNCVVEVHQGKSSRNAYYRVGDIKDKEIIWRSNSSVQFTEGLTSAGFNGGLLSVSLNDEGEVAVFFVDDYNWSHIWIGKINGKNIDWKYKEKVTQKIQVKHRSIAVAINNSGHVLLVIEDANLHTDYYLGEYTSKKINWWEKEMKLPNGFYYSVAINSSEYNEVIFGYWNKKHFIYLFGEIDINEKKILFKTNRGKYNTSDKDGTALNHTAKKIDSFDLGINDNGSVLLSYGTGKDLYYFLGDIDGGVATDSIQFDAIEDAKDISGEVLSKMLKVASKLPKNPAAKAALSASAALTAYAFSASSGGPDAESMPLTGIQIKDIMNESIERIVQEGFDKDNAKLSAIHISTVHEHYAYCYAKFEENKFVINDQIVALIEQLYQNIIVKTEYNDKMNILTDKEVAKFALPSLILGVSMHLSMLKYAVIRATNKQIQKGEQTDYSQVDLGKIIQKRDDYANKIEEAAKATLIYIEKQCEGYITRKKLEIRAGLINNLMGGNESIGEEASKALKELTFNDWPILEENLSL